MRLPAAGIGTCNVTLCHQWERKHNFGIHWQVVHVHNGAEDTSLWNTGGDRVNLRSHPVDAYHTVQLLNMTIGDITMDISAIKELTYIFLAAPEQNAIIKQDVTFTFLLQLICN